MSNKQDTESMKADSVRVIGIGASAGGLEALQQFFSHLNVDLGVAYVVIQHLSPDYKSMMSELLSRHTDLPIYVIEDGMQLKANTIYLIPPRFNLNLYQERLFLEPQESGKGLNLPIDIFFKSLAMEKGKDAIGIILSGTGSDGTVGIRAIKEQDGLVIVQDEESAKFNGMPNSALSTGLVDYVLAPQEIGEELLNYVKHPLVNREKNSGSFLSDEGTDTLTKVLFLIKNRTGVDFSYYKENTIIRRLERRVSINRFQTLEEYLPFLQKSDPEKDILYREFLIGVTHFFRDTEAFEQIQNIVLPDIFSKNNPIIRVWSTGCSTGEEAYSIAMLLLEEAEKVEYRGEIKIFASDIDRIAIEKAGYGYYPESIVANVDPLFLTKYFTRTKDGYQINKEVRNCIVFAPHNLLKDPPFSKLDLIICRNLFIYFKPEIQRTLLHRFYYSINQGGYLFMGSSETLGEMSEAFEVIDQKHKI